jgi:hypothetical protein
MYLGVAECLQQATAIILLKKLTKNCYSVQWRCGQVPLPAQLWVVSSKPASFKKELPHSN